jgi:ABC-2 type transport system ATP-binding protein
MRRRLEIARGLMHHPKILFLDEPTLGLDTQTRNLLWDYVQKLSRHEGMTIFFTTHYLDEAEAVADRIAIIDHGKIVATGTTNELARQTKTNSLEDAYLELTGRTVRDEASESNNGLNVRSAGRNSRLR